MRKFWGFTILIVVTTQVYKEIKIYHIVYFKNVVYVNFIYLKLFHLIWTPVIQTLALQWLQKYSYHFFLFLFPVPKLLLCNSWVSIHLWLTHVTALGNGVQANMTEAGLDKHLHSRACALLEPFSNIYIDPI